MSRHNVALVLPDFEGGGGIPAVTLFLRRVMLGSGRYLPRVISLPSASRDPLSVAVTRPRDWLRRPRVERRVWSGVDYQVVGARFAEFEFQRFRRRPELDSLLDGCDLVQVVAGAPATACAVLGTGIPTALHAATRVGPERRMQSRADRGLLRAWRGAMTRVTTHYEDVALRAVDSVFVDNHWLFDQIRREIPRQRVYFAPCGIDADFFTPGPRYADDGYLLAVGRFSDPRKNVRLLFDAYARLCARRPSTPELVLVGKAPTDADLAYLRTLPCAGRVRIVTDVSGEELAQWYRGASVFVLSSEEEGLGIVIIEAMGAAVPVVSTDCGGPSTTVVPGETGVLTPVGDAAALADSIGAMLDDPARAAEMGRAGRARVEAEFTLQAAGAHYLRVYDELLGESSPSAPAAKPRVAAVS